MRRQALLLPLLTTLCIVHSLPVAADLAPLPQPLTLELALSFATDARSPELAAIDSKKMVLMAEGASLLASNSTQLSLDGQVQWAEPLETPGSWVDNHKASLTIRKNIYDFGTLDSSRLANKMAQGALQSELVSAQWQRREQIMRSFFNVLLADRTADRNEEEMAGAFIRFDRTHERQRLGQASDLEVLEKESIYQKVALKRNRGIARQRLTRSQLAVLLNRAGDLPENLTTPEIASAKMPIPEYEPILKKTLIENRGLDVVKGRIEAARQNISAISKGTWPKITGEIELAETTRPGSQSDRWRIGMKLSVPLYDGGLNRAQIAKGRALIHKLQAERDGLRAQIEQKVLSEWLNLKSLREQEKSVWSELDYRELYLDNSRADYELEFKTDLGNAMVKISEAQLEIERNRYQQALAWERLDAYTNAGMAMLSAQVASAKSSTTGDQ